MKFPKNDVKYWWTNHVTMKMLYYNLSADRIKRVIRSPYRSEKGVAPETVAVMQPVRLTSLAHGKPVRSFTQGKPSENTWKEEIWVMYATSKKSHTLSLSKGSNNEKSLARKLGTISPSANRKIIITAWRYPGVSPVRDQIPIPADILEELKNIKY